MIAPLAVREFRPPIPADAPRRSYFAKVIREGGESLRFPPLLRELAPKLFAELTDHRPRACYLALLDYLKDLFPIHEAAFFHANEARENIYFESYYMPGVPFAFLGLESHYYDVDSPGLSWLLCFFYPNENDWNAPGWKGIKLLRKNGTKVDFWRTSPFYHDPEEEEDPEFDDFDINERVYDHVRSIHPAKGRAWVKPWNLLPDFLRWGTGTTGLSILDIGEGYAEEASYEQFWPEWSAAEIRGMARTWARWGKPTYDHANEFVDWLDADPAERLPLFDGALRKDDRTMRRITRPKKTLAQQFTRGQR